MSRCFVLLAMLLPASAFAQVFKCEIDGAIVYQSFACPDGAERTMRDDNISTIPRRRVNQQAQANTRNNPTPARQSARQAPTGMAGSNPTQPEPSELCDRWVKRVARIDVEARHRSTARLANERRELVDLIWQNNCSMIR